MKRLLYSLLACGFIALHTGIMPLSPNQSSQTPKQKLSVAKRIDLSKIYGKIQFVEHFPDYKVQVVEHFPDLKVKKVEHFPDAAGKWQVVEHFPDYKIQIVEHFPDFKIKYVEHFPGVVK